MNLNYLILLLFFLFPPNDSEEQRISTYDYLIEVTHYDAKSGKPSVRYEYWKFNDGRKSLWSNFTTDNYYRVELLTSMLNDDLIDCCKDSSYISNQKISLDDESSVNPFFEEDPKYAFKLKRGKTCIVIHALATAEGCLCAVDYTRFGETYKDETVFFCPFKAKYRKLKKEERLFFKQHRGFFGKTMSYHFPE